MINSNFIEKMMWHGSYILDGSTDGTYNACYLSEESLMLKKQTKERKLAIQKEYQAYIMESGNPPLMPCTISITQLDVSKSGRGLKPRLGVLKAKFRECELSPYKQHRPYQVSTSIWKLEGTPCLFYGLPAITQENSKAGKDIGDLLIIHTTDWKKLEVYVFKGLGTMEYQSDVINYIMTKI